MDYLSLIKAKEDEEQALYARMQSDADLLYLKKYTLTDPKGHAIPDVVNVTLNKPAVFGANVVSALGSVKQQVVVTSENKGIDTSYVEHFQDAMFSMANYRLMKRGEAMLNPFADTQFCFRGRTARRVCVRVEDGQLVVDIQPWDGRYVTFDNGIDGLRWASYKTTRSKWQVESEYPGVTVKGSTAEVRDVWDREINQVWVDGHLVMEQPHGYTDSKGKGYVPVVVETVPLGYGNILMDDNRVARTGESIFFLIREIVPQINMLVTILQTLNLKLVKAPMQFASKEGPQATPPEYEDALASGSITSVEMGGGITPVSYGDARNAAQMAFNMMEKAIQDGGYTDIDIGNVKQPFSAVALITIGESKDQVYLPRLAAKENMNTVTADMFTSQFVQLGESFKVGLHGHGTPYKSSKLSGDYTTAYRYFVKSPKTDIARMSVANAAQKWYPRRYVLEEVLQVEDVGEVERQWNMQEAELISPNVKKYRIIMALLDEAERGDDNAAREAKIMALELGISIEQLKMGIMAPPQKPRDGMQPVPQQPKGVNYSPENSPEQTQLLGAGGQNGGIQNMPMPTGVDTGANMIPTEGV